MTCGVIPNRVNLYEASTGSTPPPLHSYLWPRERVFTLMTAQGPSLMSQLETSQVRLARRINLIGLPRGTTRMCAILLTALTNLCDGPGRSSAFFPTPRSVPNSSPSTPTDCGWLILGTVNHNYAGLLLETRRIGLLQTTPSSASQSLGFLQDLAPPRLCGHRFLRASCGFSSLVA